MPVNFAGAIMNVRELLIPSVSLHLHEIIRSEGNYILCGACANYNPDLGRGMIGHSRPVAYGPRALKRPRAKRDWSGIADHAPALGLDCIYVSLFALSQFVVFESVCACMCVDYIDVCFESDRLPAKKDFTRWKAVQLASETYDNTPHSPCSSTSKLLEAHKRFFCQALCSRRSWWSRDLFRV